jgi:hypothetical protein
MRSLLTGAGWTIFDDPDRRDPFREAAGERLGDQDLAGQRRRSRFQLDVAARRGDLEHLGGFADVSSRVIRWTARLTSAELRALYASQIEIRRLPDNERQHVLDTMETIVDAEFGGVVHRPFVTVLYTGRRPGQARRRSGRALFVLHLLEREERHGERQGRQAHQQERVVVAGCAVEPEAPAAEAAVDQYPVALSAHRYRDRLHACRAVGLAITGSIAVEVPGPQAAGTVVAMGCSRSV